jgi:hypothetical protein
LIPPETMTGLEFLNEEDRKRAEELPLPKN